MCVLINPAPYTNYDFYQIGDKNNCFRFITMFAHPFTRLSVNLVLYGHGVFFKPKKGYSLFTVKALLLFSNCVMKARVVIDSILEKLTIIKSSNNKLWSSYL